MDWTLFAVFLAATIAAGTTGAVFKPGAWYDSLAKPDWLPPKWAFPVVWTLLYLLMSWAAARIAGQEGSALGMALWALQIALNTLWTPVFFGAHRKGMGVLIIGALWLTVAALLIQFWALDFWAGLMILPYLAWLTIATALNFWVWRNNRGAGPAEAA